MKITDYADVIKCNIKLTYYHNQDMRWCASFEHAEVSERSILVSKHGNGPTPQDAINDYLEAIRGKTLVFNATGGDKRLEYKVPMNIEA